MRAIFLLGVLCLASFYTYVAFADLSFLSSTGRLGPGFFPRLIGILLIATCVYSLLMEAAFRLPRNEEHDAGHWGITAIVAGFSAGFVLLLEILGGLPAMILFMLGMLSLLNRGRILQNVVVSLLLPAALYLMFHVWLKASFPEGLISLPG
ncbi:tripartite tricarboxylate transporter TctB family protein [Microvirga massiliensis]|uniref:tripartite tricarboxylate transporter TctB family protein n=1 Tax=Microvirga massiliensis TaxID=1033741 RepID=UPI00062B7D1A|nr:tripartite tricarboxylate transporter TctB family protein [Microvirga massiliensis]